MARELDFISHWHQLIENFQTPALGFYRSVEAAVQARAVPEAHWSQIVHKEGGLGSAERTYLRIHRGKYAFDVCAAPFGTGFFISWWFAEPPLKFALLYTLGFFFALMIVMTFAFPIGFAVGAAIGLGTSVGGMFALVSILAILWFLGNAIRQGKIGGESTVLAMPLVGRIYERVFAPPTFYNADTALMFQDAVHRAILEVYDCVTANKGVRALTEAERKPIMKRFGPSA